MSILTVLVVLVVVGVALYLVNTITMDGRIKNALNAVAILFLVLWLFDVFFGLGSIGHVRLH